jgi:alkaline phosphatase D
MTNVIPAVVLASLLIPATASSTARSGNTATAELGMATGFKIVEVTPESAVIWTRLTRSPERNSTGPDFAPQDDALPAGRRIGEMLDSAEGTSGEVRVLLRTSNSSKIQAEAWLPVNPAADFTRVFHLPALQPDTTYSVTVEGRVAPDAPTSVSLDGSFTTAPAETSTRSVSFTVVTGQDDDRKDDPSGHRIYRHMLNLRPSFFVHTGDVVYYDKATPWAKNATLARYKWQAMYSLPFQRDFHRHVPSYFMRDDHDTTRNDSWPGIDYGDLSWEQGLEIFEEQTGVPRDGYRTVRFGRDLQVWLMEGRKYRSANRAADGPDKTIWGTKQKQWFFETVQASDATFRILISPTPVVGPDRKNKNDNHANEGFAHEGNELRDFLATQSDMYVVCGDRHWQYVSIDPRTGVTEYSCGPTSNEHAGGWKNSYRSEMHQYLNVQGGFLHVSTSRVNGKPQLVFRHYDVDGQIANEVTHTPAATE